MKRKVLVGSLLSALMSLSVIVGGTFALFTSKAETNIAISSGKVKVNANVVSLTHYTNGVEQNENWVNGGKASYSNGNITIDRITPGDSVKIVIDVENESNVAAYYRTLVDVVSDNGLANGLQISIESSNGSKTGFSGFAYHDWASLSSQGVVETITITIALPETAGNEYQDKSSLINFAVEAVQGNADAAKTTNGLTTNDAGEVLINDATDLKILAANVNNVAAPVSYANKTVKLVNDIDLNNDFWTPIGLPTKTNSFVGNFDGNGKTIKNFYVNNAAGSGLFGVVEYNNTERNYQSVIENLTVDNATIYSNHWAGGIVGYIYGDVIDCTVTNTTINVTPDGEEGNYDNGDKAGGIVGFTGGTSNFKGNTVDNVNITAYRDLGGLIGTTSGKFNKIIENNTVKNVVLAYDNSGKTYSNPQANAAGLVGRVINPAYDLTSNNTLENIALPDGWVADTEALEASTDDTAKTISIANAGVLTALSEAVDTGKTYDGYTITLTDDVDLKNVDWKPIGNSTNKFQGDFDGNGHTISNLNVEGNSSYVGLFGYTINGHIENVNIHNATVNGYIGVGVVAGSPYTTSYNNITVTGDVKVEGLSYIGIFGRNLYADATNITINVNPGSYVRANSVAYDPTSQYADANGYVTYRTYVGGVVGFMGEGNHKLENVTSNIDVYGSTCDVGGLVGIAHYGNSFINCTVKANVSIFAADPADLNSPESIEIGGIAGVWHNGGADVTFDNCKFEGTLSVTDTEGNVYTGPWGNNLVNCSYSATGNGQLIIK